MADDQQQADEYQLVDDSPPPPPPNLSPFEKLIWSAQQEAWIDRPGQVTDSNTIDPYGDQFSREVEQHAAAQNVSDPASAAYDRASPYYDPSLDSTTGQQEPMHTRQEADGTTIMEWTNSDGTRSEATLDTGPPPGQDAYFGQNTDGTTTMEWTNSDGSRSEATLMDSPTPSSDTFFRQESDGTTTMEWTNSDGTRSEATLMGSGDTSGASQTSADAGQSDGANGPQDGEQKFVLHAGIAEDVYQKQQPDFQGQGEEDDTTGTRQTDQQGEGQGGGVLLHGSVTEDVNVDGAPTPLEGENGTLPPTTLDGEYDHVPPAMLDGESDQLPPRDLDGEYDTRQPAGPILQAETPIWDLAGGPPPADLPEGSYVIGSSSTSVTGVHAELWSGAGGDEGVPPASEEHPWADVPGATGTDEFSAPEQGQPIDPPASDTPQSPYDLSTQEGRDAQQQSQTVSDPNNPRYDPQSWFHDQSLEDHQQDLQDWATSTGSVINQDLQSVYGDGDHAWTDDPNAKASDEFSQPQDDTQQGDGQNQGQDPVTPMEEAQHEANYNPEADYVSNPASSGYDALSTAYDSSYDTSRGDYDSNRNPAGSGSGSTSNTVASGTQGPDLEEAIASGTVNPSGLAYDPLSVTDYALNPGYTTASGYESPTTLADPAHYQTDPGMPDSNPQDNVPQDNSSQNSVPQDNIPQDNSQNSVPQDNSTQDSVPQDSAPQDSNPPPAPEVQPAPEVAPAPAAESVGELGARFDPGSYPGLHDFVDSTEHGGIDEHYDTGHLAAADDFGHDAGHGGI